MLALHRRNLNVCVRVERAQCNYFVHFVFNVYLQGGFGGFWRHYAQQYHLAHQLTCGRAHNAILQGFLIHRVPVPESSIRITGSCSRFDDFHGSFMTPSSPSYPTGI